MHHGLAILILICAMRSAAGQETRPIIAKIADIPQFTYSVPDSTEELIRSPEAFARLAGAVEADLLKLQSGYDLQSGAVRRQVLELLVKLDLLTGRFDSGIERGKRLKGLQTKTSLRLTTMLVEIAYMQAARENGTVNPEVFQPAFRNHLREAVAAIPYDVAYVNLVSIRGFADRSREAFLIDSASQEIEPARKRNATLNSDLAWRVIGARCEYVLMTVRDATISVVRAQEIAHGGPPKGIWPERSIVLDEHRHLTPVTVAVWDSGVDASLFPGRMWMNPEGRTGPDQREGNGFRTGVHGIAFTATGEKSPELIWPLTEEEKLHSEQLSALVKGSFDIFADPDSTEAKLYRNVVDHTAPDKIDHLLSEIEHFRRASHGTGCASVAAEGNPFVRILSARTSNDSDWTHQPPTINWVQADARIFREMVHFFRDQNVRAVNISWGETPQGFERALERYGNEHDPVRLREKARQAFDIEKQALLEAIAGTPSILFVAASGNSDEDTAGAEMIPQSFKLPNLITVGAVDRSGYAGPFTIFSSVVSIYASGFERAALLGGREYEFMGTSAAAPAVVNLAAKLLAVQPKLNATQVIDLVKRGGSRNDQGLLVLNPKRSLQILEPEPMNR